MKSLKEYIMSNSEKKMSNSRVTTMTYDLETRNDNNINQEVKVLLGAKGWNFTIPERRQIKYYGNNVTQKDVEAPDTTAWKENISPSEACNEFKDAIQIYNNNHNLDTPMRFGKGNAFAVRDNEYDAIEIC